MRRKKLLQCAFSWLRASRVMEVLELRLLSSLVPLLHSTILGCAARPSFTTTWQLEMRVWLLRSLLRILPADSIWVL
jgi:hypothetical protein